AALEAVIGDLLLVASVRVHSPDLHGAVASGAEVNVFTVRRIIRAIVNTFRGSQARLGAPGSGNRVHVIISVTKAHKGQRLPVGRPTMPVRRRFRDLAWSSAGKRHNINAVVMIFRGLVGDGKLRTVGRKAVIIDILNR